MYVFHNSHTPLPCVMMREDIVSFHEEIGGNKYEKIVYARSIHSTFLSSYKTAKLVTENEDIFPKPATMEDYEKLMLYALAMFIVHDEVHDKLLNDKIIYDATMDIYTSMLKNEVLPPDEVYDLAKDSNAVLNDFLKEHWIFMHNSNGSNDLIKYVSTILSKIPSCKDYNGYTLAGVTFASCCRKSLMQ